MAPEAEAAVIEGGRVQRNRRRRSQAFLSAGLRIVADEGLEALTMARLAEELDTAVGSVYRYYPSKRDLVAAIQAGAIDRLRRSYDASVGPVVDAVLGRLDEPPALVRLVALGRWTCAAGDRYAEEVRLLQMVSSQRAPSVSPEAANELLAPTMELVLSVSGTIESAIAAGDLQPGNALARAIVWLTAFGGVCVADDLARFVPDVLGGARLVRRLTVDLFVGWGASLNAVERIDAAIDALGADLPLAR
jgi:AcrR family transcriptional regulator